MDRYIPIPLLVKWKCSRCRQFVEVECITIIPKVENKVRWESKEQSDNNSEVQEILNTIHEEQKKGSYRTAALNCKCPNCGFREPWSRLRFFPIEYSLIPVFCIALFLLFFSVKFGLIILSVPLVYLLVRITYHKIMENKIPKLPDESLPNMSYIVKGE